MSKKRDTRLMQEIRKTLSVALHQSPPDLGLITITEVEISDDWSVVDVWFSVLGTHDASLAEAWLSKNQKKWQKALAPLERKFIPEVRWKFDKRPQIGQELENMIQ